MGSHFSFSFNYNHSQAYRPKNWGNYEEWSFSDFGDGLGDFLLKIDYVTYGEKYRTPFYVSGGNLSHISLKNSFLVNHFKPNLNYPQRRQLSLEAGYHSGGWGSELFVADFSSGEIFGARSYYRPLLEHYLFKKMELCVSAAMDLGPENLSRKTVDTRIYLLGLDLNIPIYNLSESATFNFFTQYDGALYNRGQGIQTARGFAYSYGMNGTVLDSISYHLGGIILKDDYPDSYFDAIYLKERSHKLNQLLSEEREKNRYGVYASLNFDFEHILKLDLSYRQISRRNWSKAGPKTPFLSPSASIPSSWILLIWFWNTTTRESAAFRILPKSFFLRSHRHQRFPETSFQA